MEMTTSRTVELEVIASSLRRHERMLGEFQNRLHEALEYIEKQDMTPNQVREYMSWVGHGLRELGRELQNRH